MLLSNIKGKKLNKSIYINIKISNKQDSRKRFDAHILHQNIEDLK